MKWKYFFFLVLFLAIFGGWIANEKPIYCRYQGENYFPILELPLIELGWKAWPAEFHRGNWSELVFEKKINTLVPYSPETIDRNNLGFKGPFEVQKTKSLRERHWMGTDRFGRDVLSGWIRGFRMAASIGILSVCIAGILGIFFGGIAGFYGQDRFNLSVVKATILFIWIAGLVFWISLGFETQWGFKSVLYWQCIWVILGICLMYVPFRGPQTSLPLDGMISLVIQIIEAIPPLFFIMALIPLLKNPGLMDVVMLIALIRWTGIARLVRAEFFRIRDLEYIQAVRLLKINHFDICWKHILPNALGSLWITFAYSFAGAILLEAYLGFLGIGLPSGTVSWGSQMQQVREYPAAWWLAVFPGLAIFLCLFSLQKMGERLESKSF
jgi:peptide/nickel transport system permease protein